MSRRSVLAAALIALVVASGCGSDNGSGSGDKPRLTVSAATSLTRAFTAYGAGYSTATVRLQFAGSDELAAQIRQGVRPDVYAAANTKLPDALRREGLVGRPVVFTSNRLVIAVPAGSERVASLADLAKPGVTIAAGAPSVPIGSYTDAVLARLPSAERAAITRNIRSREPDVGGVVAKVAQRAVDAGFVYVTDVRGASGRLRAIAIPAALQPRVRYAAAVVRGAPEPKGAAQFIAGLTAGAGATALRAAGFEPPR